LLSRPALGNRGFAAISSRSARESRSEGELGEDHRPGDRPAGDRPGSRSRIEREVGRGEETAQGDEANGVERVGALIRIGVAAEQAPELAGWGATTSLIGGRTPDL
jgi:hypothetical protein